MDGQKNVWSMDGQKKVIYKTLVNGNSADVRNQSDFVHRMT